MPYKVSRKVVLFLIELCIYIFLTFFSFYFYRQEN